MSHKPTLIAAVALVAAFVAVAPPAAAQNAGFRFGDNDTSYRYLDPEHAGTAHFRSMQTFNTDYRTVRNGDDQIGPGPNNNFTPNDEYDTPGYTPDAQVNRLANDLDHHLKTSYRHDWPEYNRRYVHFRTAMQGWNSSDKTDYDLANMTKYLKTSLKYSMPGSDKFMPPLPIVNPVNLDSSSTHAPGVLDPFTDDPVQGMPR